jgi:sugar lactone lactonase YvrE
MGGAVKSRYSFGFVLLVLGACGPGSPPELATPHVTPQPGLVTTAIGTGQQGFDGDGHAPLESWLNQPTEIGFDADGRLYVLDWNNHRVRVQRDGVLQTVLGTRLPGDWPPELAADAELAGTELALNHPMDIAFGEDDQAYVAAWHNHKVLELVPSQAVVRRIAGGSRPGYVGDGGEGAAALLNFPASIVVDASGALLVADQRNNVIRRIGADASRSVATLVGVKAPSSFAGDDEAAATAGLGLCPYNEAGGADNPGPGGALALDQDGNLYLADTYNHCVRRILAGSDGLLGEGDASEEIIQTVAGTCGEAGFDEKEQPRTLLLRTPRDIEIRDDYLFIADSGNHVVWSVELASGESRRVVGTGQPGPAHDQAPPLEATLHEPFGIAFDRDGNLFIADTLNQRIRVLWSQ